MAASGVHVVRAGSERIADLERLWMALQRHHADLAGALPDLASRSLEESWDRRRAAYATWLAEPEAFVLLAEPVGYALNDQNTGMTAFAPAPNANAQRLELTNHGEHLRLLLSSKRRTAEPLPTNGKARRGPMRRSRTALRHVRSE